MTTLPLFGEDRPASAPAPASPASPTAPAAPRAATGRPAAPPADLLVVDGDGLAHRAFHAFGTGHPDGPVHGFFALLAGVAEQAPADGLLVGFDSRERSRRRERWPAYKAQRASKPPALEALLFALPDALTDLGVAVVTAEGWEADDVLASAAAALEAAGQRGVLATADRDAFCLISADVTVLRLRQRAAAVRVNPEQLRREVGVGPEQYLEFAALRGDPSDNLPGVPGIGRARAAALLTAYPTVAAAASDPMGTRSVLGRGPGQALLDDVAAGAASVFARNLGLMTPYADIPIDLAASARRPDPERVLSHCQRWGVPRVAARLATAIAARPDPVPPPEAPED